MASGEQDGIIRTSRIVALSLVVGLFFTAQTVLMTLASGFPINVQRDVAQELLFWVVWSFFTPTVLRAAQRWPLDTKPLYRPLVAHAATSAVLAPTQTAIAFSLRPLALWLAGRIPASGVADWMARARTPMVWGVFMGVFFYWVIVGVYTALRFRGLYMAQRVSAAELATRGAALEAELTGAKLDALRSQLRPHFLFNTLNAISVLAVDDADKTRRMLLRLSSLLRRSLDEESHEISLRQELAFLDDYLDIQRVRFGDRLAVQLAIDSDVLDARVPVLLLQPFMENAIEHGGSGKDGRSAISLRATREGEMLRVTLENDGGGPGAAAGVPLREGIGLTNSRARLQQLYGHRASVQLHAANGSAESPGTRVEIRIPFSPMSARATV